MEDLIVVTYNNQYSAVENMQALRGLDFDWVVDVRDAVAVTRDSYGKLHIQDSYKPTTGEGVGWGVLLGTMLGGHVSAFTAGMSTAGSGSGGGRGRRWRCPWRADRRRGDIRRQGDFRDLGRFRGRCLRDDVSRSIRFVRAGGGP